MIFLVEHVVLIPTILIFPIMLWLLISRQKTQQALRWWYHRQNERMCKEAELIRNQTLQDFFVMRRHIELSIVNSSETFFDQSYLDRIQNIHCSLKELSEYLYPAHIDDSLILAIRSHFETWKSRFSTLNIQLELPEVWENESEIDSRILLMMLDEILQIISFSNQDLSSILVKLEQQGQHSKLKLEILGIEMFNRTCNSYLPELDYLCSIFKILTGGNCYYKQGYATQTWYFYW